MTSAVRLSASVALAAAAACAAPAQQAPATPGPAALRADLAQFRAEFLGVERSYATGARARAEQRLRALDAALDTIGIARFELELARIVALADNGHTNVPPAQRSQRYNRIPVRLVPFGTEFHVVRARRAHADLLGARLVAVDGRAVSEARAAAHTLVGGNTEFRDRTVPVFLESPQLLHAAGLARAASGALYTFQGSDGRRIERRIEGDAPVAGPAFTATRAIYPDPDSPEPGDWVAALAPASAPWSLRDARARFRWRDAPELGALVIELRQNRSTPGFEIGEFIAAVERELRARKPQHVVLDMRMNGGGDLNTTRDFMRALPTLVPGRVFILTSPWTFSAAISSIGYVKQAASGRVTIVGEHVGDRLEFWAEGRPVTLTNTHILISRATERHDYATGCRPYTDCHGSVVRNPISVASLAPDIAAPWTIDAYLAGRDPAMDAVERALARRSGVHGVGGGVVQRRVDTLLHHLPVFDVNRQR